ncbi:MAG: ArnT family glycosyltransferase [Bacteroidales bacterium]
MEREFRESSDMRPSIAGLAGVLAVAAALRFWGLGHGIPGSLAPGEADIMQRVMRMMFTGDLNPHVFDYPGLYVYVQLVVACARFLLGAMGGAWQSLAAVAANDFYLWGRALGATLGVATVYLVYMIGTRWGARHALLGAGLLAVMPDHVGASHSMLIDVPTAFAVTLTFLLALRAHEMGTLRGYWWAGVSAGAAAATNYSGSLAFVLPIVAAYVQPKGPDSSIKRALASLAGFIAAFLVGAPFTVLDLPGFLNGMAAPGQAGANAVGGWLAHLAHFAATLWWPGLILMLVGLVLAVIRVVRGPGRARFAMLVAVPFVQVVVIGMRQGVPAGQLLPVVPFACLLTAIAVISGVSLLRRFAIPRPARTALIVAGTVATLLPPLVNSIRVLRHVSPASSAAHHDHRAVAGGMKPSGA